MTTDSPSTAPHQEVKPNKSRRGGKREGAGRPTTSRTKNLNVRVSEEAYDKAHKTGNISRYINNLILDDK